MIEALGAFVPVAANTAFTQWRDEDDPLRKFFYQVVDQTDWKTAQEGNTTQGMYACASDGTLFGHTFEYDLETVLGVLRDATKEAAKHAAKKLDLRGAKPEPAPPEGTLVVSVYTRIDPLPEGASKDNAFVGRDHLWILHEEVDALRKGQFPKTLAMRLARFHLWDNTRGEPDAWTEEQVKKAAFGANGVLAGHATFTIGGTFSLAASAGKRSEDGRSLPEAGYEGKIEGEITFGKEGVTSFTLLATGEAWGEGTYTPGAPAGRFPLKVAFVLPAADDPTRGVPPQGVSDGLDEYLGR